MKRIFNNEQAATGTSDAPATAHDHRFEGTEEGSSTAHIVRALLAFAEQRAAPTLTHRFFAPIIAVVYCASSLAVALYTGSFSAAIETSRSYLERLFTLRIMPPPDMTLGFPLLVEGSAALLGDMLAPYVLIICIAVAYALGWWDLFRTMHRLFPASHYRAATFLTIPVFVVAPAYLGLVGLFTNEGPFMALSFFAYAFLLRAVTELRAADALAAGLLLALANLFKPLWVLTPALLMLWFLIINDRRRALLAALAMLAVVLLQLPTLVFFHAVAGRWQLGQTINGAALVEGNFPPLLLNVSSISNLPAEQEQLLAQLSPEDRSRWNTLQQAGGGLRNPENVNAAVVAAVWNDMREHPAEYLRVLPRKFNELILEVPGGDTARERGGLFGALWQVYWVVHIILLACFFFMHWPIRYAPGPSLFAGLFYLTAVQALPFVVSPRHLMAVTPLLYWAGIAGIAQRLLGEPPPPSPNVRK